MEISVTNPQSLAQEGKWEMRGWVMTILLCSSYWCWSEDTPQSKWRWPTSSSMRSSTPREGLGPPIVTSLNDQLPLFIHSFLPRAPMPPEAGLRLFWHLPSLETQDSCCSSLSAQPCQKLSELSTLKVYFGDTSLFSPAPEHCSGTLWPTGKVSQSPGSLRQISSLLLEFCIPKGTGLHMPISIARGSWLSLA